jgi:K+-transporting ATPase c subunit
VAKYSAGRYLGFFGAPYVNVMSLNMALAQLKA